MIAATVASVAVLPFPGRQLHARFPRRPFRHAGRRRDAQAFPWTRCGRWARRISDRIAGAALYRHSSPTSWAAPRWARTPAAPIRPNFTLNSKKTPISTNREAEDKLPGNRLTHYPGVQTGCAHLPARSHGREPHRRNGHGRHQRSMAMIWIQLEFLSGPPDRRRAHRHARHCRSSNFRVAEAAPPLWRCN